MADSNTSPQIAAFANILEQPTALPPVKRYITSHDDKGNSVIHSSPAQKYRGDVKIGGVARSFTSPGLPARIQGNEDIEAYLSPDAATHPTSHLGLSIVNPGGTNMTVVEFAPGQSSQMHRTLSIDYVVCVAGHLQLELDGGETVDLHVGDHVVQRGTMHRWVNPSSTEPARLIAVVVPAAETEIMGKDGKMKLLKEEHLEGSEK